MKVSGFSLLELIVVIIIIGVFTMVGLVNHSRIIEQTLDKEADVNLRMVQSAERTYHMEYTVYYPQEGSSTDIEDLNEELKIYLPEESDPKWNYTVYSDGTVTAVRNIKDGRTWRLEISDEDPVCAGKYCP